MNPLGDGLAGYALILAVAVLAHEPWRWLGAYLGQSLKMDDEIFFWVRAVSTALIAGLAMRLVVFPQGGLEAIPLWIRLLSLTAGVIAFFVTRRNLFAGIAAASAVVSLGAYLN